MKTPTRILNAKGIASGLARYAACLFSPSDLIEVRLLPSGRSYWCPAADLSGLAPALLRDNQAGQSICAGINPRRQHGGRVAEDVALARCLVADFDDTMLPEARRCWQKAGLPLPTLVIHSGHGIHSYLRLAQPVNDLALWSRLQRALSASVGGDPNISDPPRVLRLPGFVNHKSPPAPTRILDSDPSRAYRLADLLPLLPDAPKGDNQGGGIVTQSTPTPMPLLGPGTLRLAPAARARLYLATVPGSISGQKGHNQAFKAACILVHGFQLDDETALALLREWNQRCICPDGTPYPWSEPELRRKVRQARQRGSYHNLLDEAPTFPST